MELNAGSAFGAAALAVVFGFGAAFWIGSRAFKIRESMGQRTCAWIFTISLAIGLTGLINEYVGMPMQGLRTDYSKVVSYVFINSVLIPLIAWITYIFLSPKERGGQSEKSPTMSSTPVAANISTKVAPIQHNDAVGKVGRFAMEKHSSDTTKEPTLAQWEAARIEYDSVSRHGGLWAKLFSQYEGDETRIRAAYYRIRAAEIAVSPHNKADSGSINKTDGNFDSIEKHLRSRQAIDPNTKKIEIDEGLKERYRNSSDKECIDAAAHSNCDIDFLYPVKYLYNGNYAIEYKGRHKIYSSRESVINAVEVYGRAEIFPHKGWIHDIDSSPTT
jgi:hypothetical protein